MSIIEKNRIGPDVRAGRDTDSGSYRSKTTSPYLRTRLLHNQDADLLIGHLVRLFNWWDLKRNTSPKKGVARYTWPQLGLEVKIFCTDYLNRKARVLIVCANPDTWERIEGAILE